MAAVFDGHNDTLTRDDADDFATGRNGGHIDLPRARRGGLAGAIFAAFTPTPGMRRVRRPVGLAAPVRRQAAAAVVERTFARLDALERDGHVRVVLGPGDLDAAREQGVLAAVKHV